MGVIPLRSIQYQWESLLYRDRSTLQRKKEFIKDFSYKIISRNKDKTADEIEFSIYMINSSHKIILAGEFNNWGKDNPEKYCFSAGKKDFLVFRTRDLKHKDPYLFLVQSPDGEQFHRDPAAVYFDEKGNCVFWDFEDPSAYKLQYDSPERLHRSTKIIQTDVFGLISKWPTFKEEKNIFKFISRCGVIKKIKELGFNTIQFLPVSQCVDGDNWKYRYLSPFPFALEKNLGDPDSFKEMVDAFHKEGISVILDIILSHAPFKKFKLFNLNGEDVGIHTWKHENGEDIFLDELTSWGTKRFRYQDAYVQEYLVQSALHFLTMYGVDGFRIDNVDGILRLGPSGEGSPREGGRSFLRKLINSIHEHDPLAYIHLESHYFFGNNARLLVAPLKSDVKALGATAYNSSRLTYNFHSEFMPKSADEFSVWSFEYIRREKEWGKSNSTVADFHNHDAAAGLMYGRATGSYAYDALILGKKELHKHAVGKIKCMESLIAFGCEGRILDLLQTFLLQTGSFEHDSSIDWNLIKENNLLEFKKEINTILDIPAFWPENVINREFSSIDDKNKILVIIRKDTSQVPGEEYICIINFSSRKQESYSVGVREENYECIFDSEKILKKEFASTQSNKFEFFSKEINIHINPYHCIVLRNKNSNKS